MSLHRTPVHPKALRMVRDGQVRWRPADPRVEGKPSPRRPAGFARPNGGRLEPSVLVALWELLQAHLIAVDVRTVSLTEDGEVRLSEWDGTRTVRS